MADKSFIVEAIFRAQDQASRVFESIGSASGHLLKTLEANFGGSAASLAQIALQAHAAGGALNSGNFAGAVAQASFLASALRGATAAETAAGAEGAAAVAGVTAIGAAGAVAAGGAIALAAALPAVVTALVAAGQQGAAYAAELAAVSERTGLTVEEVSRLGFAASQSHANVEELQNGLKFLSRNLFEAGRTAGDSRDLFLALGFSLDQLKSGSISPRDALLKIADAIAAIPSPSQRTGVALLTMGRAAQTLVPLLSRGAEGIRELEGESDRLRVTVSAAQAKVGVEFKESMAALTQQMDELKASIGEGVVPPLTSLVKLLNETVLRVDGAIDKLKELRELNPGTIFATMQSGVEAALPGMTAFDHALAHIAETMAVIKALGKLGKFEDNPAPPPPQQGPPSPASAFLNAPTERDALGEARFGKVTSGASSFDTATKQGTNDLLDRIKAIHDQEAAEEAAIAAAKEHAKKIAELRAEYDKLVGSVNNLAVSQATAAKLFAIDPEHAKAAVEAINKAALDASQPRLFKITVDKDGALKSVEASKKEIQDFLNGNPDKLTLSPVIPRSQQELGRGPSVIEDTKSLAEIPLNLGKAVERTIDWQKELEHAGVNIEGLLDDLTRMHTSLGSIAATGAEVSAVLGVTFQRAFDPVTGEVGDVENAVGSLRGSFDQAFDSLPAKILSGDAAMLKFSNIVEGAGKAFLHLVLDIELAIAKALILKAIFAAFGIGVGGPSAADLSNPAFVASGGTIGSTGKVEHFAEGGVARAATLYQTIQHFAMGGVVQAQRVIHAARGFTVPGAASHTDTFPAMLAAGETVLENSGVRTPAAIIRDVGSSTNELTKIVTNLVHVLAPGGAAGGGDTYNVTIPAIDADSFRSYMRTGNGARELAYLNDPARG